MPRRTRGWSADAPQSHLPRLGFFGVIRNRRVARSRRLRLELVPYVEFAWPTNKLTENLASVVRKVVIERRSGHGDPMSAHVHGTKGTSYSVDGTERVVRAVGVAAG